MDPQSSIIVENLLESISDKDEKVRNAICASLLKIARCYPSEIISVAVDYRRKNPKLNIQEVRFIYNLIKNICEEKLSNIDPALIHRIIEYATDESLKSAELPFISADVLTVIGVKYCSEIFEYISKYMPEGIAPHASIVYVIGNLSIVNMIEFERFNKKAFDYLLSILPATKTDNMRKLYATTISQLVETVIERTSTEESAVAKQSYSPIVEEIYETSVSVWLQIKDIKICETIIQSAGSMVLLFNDQKLTNDATKILNTFLGFYKKFSALPRFVITQAISNLLSVVPRSALQSSLDPLLQQLHVLVCIPLDYDQLMTVKNHSEVLRCYDSIGTLFEDKLCETIFRNLRSPAEQDRIMSLLVASHMLKSSKTILKTKISEIVSVLRNLLDETSVRLNKNVVNIVVALARMDYLTEKDTVFIEFLVKHCHHSTSSSDLSELETTCKSTVYLFSTNIVSIQPVCWKVLLHTLMNGDYCEAAETFSKCLAYLVKNCDHSALDKNCYERSETVFVHVIKLLGSPLHDNRGVPLLNFIHDYVLWKVKVDTIIWKIKIPQLISYLETSEWNELTWENKLLDTVAASFTDDTKPWLEAVNTEILKLLSDLHTNNDYNHNANINNVMADERAVLYKLLALITQYMDDETVINNNIEKILSPITQRWLIDLKACSRSVGILSKTNFARVFKKLDSMLKTLLTKKTTKMFGLIKDSKCETDVEIVRRMICECYCAILSDASSGTLLPKLKQILFWLINVMQNAKDWQTKNSCMEALLKGSEILLQNENEYENTDECRTLLYTFVSNAIEMEKSMPTVTCLKMVTYLFKLSTRDYETANDKLLLVQKCLNRMFQYYSVSTSTAAITENGLINDDVVIRQLCFLIEQTVKTKNASVLEEIVVFLQPWLSHRIINHRLISLFLLRSATVCYCECYFQDAQNFSTFSHISSLLGRIYVRTFESNAELSKLAGECVILLLAIAEAKSDNTNVVVSMQSIRESMSNFKPCDMESFRVAACCKLSHEQLTCFVENLTNGLSDSEIDCSLGTAKLLQILFKENGSQFLCQALDIFGNIWIKLTNIENEKIKLTIVEAVLALARHHKDIFVNTILNQPLPLHPNVCTCWHELSKDEHLTGEILIRLLETLEWNPLSEKNLQNDRPKPLSIRPVAAVWALKEILASNNEPEILKNNFPHLFSATLMLIPCYMGERVSNENTVKEIIPNFAPAKLMYETLLIIMKNANCKHVENNLRPFVEKTEFRLKPERQTVVKYYEMVKELAKSISHFNCDSVVKILVTLSGYRDKDKTETQRGTIAVFFVEIFLTKCGEEFILADTIIANLLYLLNDSSAFVRECSLIGLSTVSNREFSLVERYKDNVLAALVQGLDDSESSIRPGITIQSLTGLSKLIPFLNGKKYSAVFTSMMIRIKAFFEKEDVEIRSLSLKLFGELAEVAHIESYSLSEQVCRNLVCLLFHLGEKETAVVQACKFSLRAVCHLVKSEGLSSMIRKNLTDDGKLHYQEYIVKIAKILANELPELSYDYIMTALTYTKSSWPEIRAISVIFVGIMYQNQSAEFHEKLPMDKISSRLLFLLKEADSSVRANAALALGSLIQKLPATQR